jgi:DNA invertase Pin-like site-specific DNA recombinase
MRGDRALRPDDSHALVGEFYDAAVNGADPIETRPGFAAMLEWIEGNGVRVLTASGEDLTSPAAPAKVMLRQIVGAFAQHEKARLVAKLKGARDRRSAELGQRIEGRKGYAAPNPALVREAKRLARRSLKTSEARKLGSFRPYHEARRRSA